MREIGSRYLKTSPGNFGFVRKYLIGIFLVVCLTVVSIFWGFSYKEGNLIKEQLPREARAFFQEIVLTRQWGAKHGGVYVKLRPGVEVSPYLLKIPGLKVVITDSQGERYTLKNPAVMTREISELADRKGLFKFRITSLKPFNPSNEPDSFERRGLESFERGALEYASFDRKGGEIFYRYIAPLKTEQACLTCHAAQGYRLGDIRGGISVTIPATDMMHQLSENRLLLVISAVGILILIFAIILFISKAFINHIAQVEDKLVELANHDFLTGLLNRREMFKRAEVELFRSERHGGPLSVILFDIDRFKNLNDTYGHSTGDSILKELSAKLREILRNYDIFCRYGGEEFVVVLPQTELAGALDLAERLRLKALEVAVPFGAGKASVGVSISAGVAQRAPGEEMDKVISRADAALYRAKANGRNRVEQS